MRALAERAYFHLCVGLGRLIRGATYSNTRIVHRDCELIVRKARRFYAPLLISMGGPLLRLLDVGVRVLPQRDWVERERSIYLSLRGSTIRVDADGTLILPCLAGETLATLLDDSALETSARRRAIELAVVALADVHARGLTHGDAMAENVMVDLDAGVAHWFDFETMHESHRPKEWRRADDVRALLASCVLRTIREELAETLHLVVEVYSDEGATRLAAASFTSVLRRSLAFHLGQAALSFSQFQEIGRLLKARLGDSRLLAATNGFRGEISNSRG